MSVSRFALPVLIAVMASTTACSHSDKQRDIIKAESSPIDIVDEAYSHLLKAEYADYLLCVQSADSLPQEYRQNLIKVLKQAANEEMFEHNGMVRAKATSEERNEADTYALVRVDVVYGDSTKEEIAVQAVKVGGRWRLK